MSKIKILSILACLFIFSYSYSQTSLSGNYSIDSSGGGDYLSFTTAISDLTTNGVSGPVSFLVEPGTYTEQVVITPITGASATNTVSFTGNGSDSLSVILTYNQTSFPSNYVLKLDGADYLTFQNMTIQSTGLFYSKVIILENMARYNTFSSNHIVGQNVAYNYEDNAVIYSPNTNDGYNTFTYNAILNGSFGIYFRSTSSSSESNLIISNNYIDNFFYAGILSEYTYNAEFNNNYVRSATTTYDFIYGIYTKHMDGPSEISGNEVNLRGSNYITGIRTDFSDGSSSNPILISNNFIAQTGVNNDVVRALFIYHGSRQNIYHNTIHVTGGSTSAGRAIYMTTYGSTFTGYIKLKNNIAVNSGGGGAIYVSYNAVADNMISECDYNNFYSTGSTLGTYSASPLSSLANWQSVSGWDANSYSANPLFTSDSDLHINNLSLNGTGTPLTEVTLDIDGELRDPVTPDIGADEFGLPGPLNGTYLIDQNGTGDYTSFNEALTSLELVGVDAPVIFNVAPGTYFDKMDIEEITGVSDTSTVTFQSLNNDSSSVILTNNFSTYPENYTVKFNGADYIKFKKITITTNVTWSYCRVIQFTGGATNNEISNCEVYSVPFNAHNTEYAVIISDNGNDDSTLIANNYIHGGSYGIYMKGSSQYSPETGTQILNNTISSFSARGILIHYQEFAKVENNIIESNESNDTYNYVYGIYGGYTDESLIISGNQIHVKGYDKNYGIYLNYCDGSPTNPGNIYNNSIVQSGPSTGYCYGIHLWSSKYQKLYFNSVNITSGNTSSSAAMYLNCLSTLSNGNVELYNNSFSNMSGGYAIYVSNQALSSNLISGSNYNNFYHTGTNLGVFGNFYPENLTTWQLMSTWDNNSLSSNPGYIQNTDLHIDSVSPLLNAGTPINNIIVDIDGDPRNALTPCIGADELFIQINTVDTQLVSFPASWSIFSTYIGLDENHPDSVFSSVSQFVEIVKNDDGQVYWPPFVNLIDSITLGEGYQAKMSSACTLTFTGAAATPELTPISLPSGWCIFGYLRQSPGILEDMILSISNEVVIIKDGDGAVYWPQYSVNLIGSLIPGKGYQAKLSQLGTLTYPPN